MPTRPTQPEEDLLALTPAEALAVGAIADRILPASADLPAASALGAVVFLDRQLAGPWGAGAGMYRAGPWEQPADDGHGWQSPLTPVEAYRSGLAALDAAVRARSGRSFPELGPAEQDAVLGDLEAGGLPGFTDPAGPAFFALVHRNVLEAVLSDPRHGGNRDGLAWRWLGFPGVREGRP
jgi:gluconate 2-dehydrogenase gamma chain